MDNVKVTLSLTPEAAAILYQYAGERNRGYFVSQLLKARRDRDEAEAELLAAEDAARIAAEAAEKAQKAVAATWTVNMPRKRAKRHGGRK